MRTFKRFIKPKIQAVIVPPDPEKRVFSKKNFIFVALLFFLTLMTIPLLQNRQEIRQRADVIYSQITPEFYCLGLGGVDCQGVKTASEAALGCVGLSVTDKAILNKRYVAQYDTIAGTIVMKNGCKNTFNVQEIYLAAKDPKGVIHKFVPSGGANTTYPNQTVTIGNAQLAISPNDPTGDWTAFGGYVDQAGKVYAANTTTTFTVVEPCTTLTQSKTIVVDPMTVIVPASASASVTYQNTCKVDFKLQGVLIQATDPKGNSYDFLTTSIPPAPVTLAAGSTVIVRGTRSFTTADLLGTWSAYGAYQSAAVGTMSATWHTDVTKGTFTVASRAAAPQVPIATKSATPASRSATKSPPPPAKTVPKLAKRMVLFDFDKSDIKSQYTATLDQVVVYLKANPTAKINVVGYCDNVGTTQYNLGLSQRRAQAVESYLTGKGVAASRLSVSWKGEANPVASNATEAGRAQNRRVELYN